MKTKNNLLVLFAMATVVVVPGTTCAARSQAGGAERTMARWLSMDKDGDGKIAKDEAEGQLKANFEPNDTNKDGFLDRSELNGLSQRLSSGRSQQQSNRSQAVQLAAGAKLERDIVYSQVGGRKLLLDLCLPAKGSAPSPVIVWVHGGGWRNGSKNAGSRARGMLDRGYAVVDAGYRLSGEAIFPAQVEDCKAAVRWVRANATRYGFDPDRIGAWGSSAGGHLVAFIGTAGDVREFDTETNAQYSSRVQAVCDWFGPTDLLQMDRHMIEGSRLVHDEPGSPESLLVGGPIQKEPYKSLAGKANPITYVTKDDPPFLIMHGDKDMLVPLHQSELLLDALKKAGINASLYVVKGGGHGLRGGQESPEKLFEMVADFFDKHLKKPEPVAAPGNRRGARNRPQLRPPTYSNVKYGPHEQNVIDFYKAESDVPTPVAVFIHGGGFRGGSKRGLNAGTLRELLDAGISVAAVEYRFISHAPLPAAHHDSLRALQFIRSKADEWNIDKKRFGAFGGSAGAQICMWLAFHDEMADPSSSDPVKRESSRLTCVATSGGQTTMDFDLWMKWIPGYDKPHRERGETFGKITAEKLRTVLKDISALSILTSDDPPIFMSYGMKPGDPVPADASRAQGWKVHHVMFGIKLKEKMDELGLEADLKYPGAETRYRSDADFFIRKLTPGTE
ncbi:MAG: alpha/beta hydrolase fold domain-containing protein [Phycisphaerae bacterium]|nr:alpha/beta hydrolase fold domain-containing protein [Phycisphaerae bacterium]